MKVRNTFIIFLVSGFWHGANWTFIVWGLLNALYFLPLLLSGRNRNHLNSISQDTLFPKFKELLSMLITFLLTVIAWVFFRAETITHAFSYLQGMFSNTLFSMPLIRPTDIIMLVVAFIILEWIGRREQYAIEVLFQRKPRVVKWSFYMVLIAFILVFSNETPKEFIYFQF